MTLLLSDTLLVRAIIIGHPQRGVAYNFSAVCLSVCLSVCMCACLSDDNFRKPWRRKLIFACPVHLEAMRVTFVYEGHRIKVKVTGAKIENPHSRNLKRRPTITSVLMKFACSMRFSATADRMVWPPSLSRDRKWPHVTECMHSRLVGLRLEDNLVTFVLFNCTASTRRVKLLNAL